MSPSGPIVYLGGGSWIAKGPVIDGAIKGEVGAAGAGAGAGAGGVGAWASSSAHAPPPKPASASPSPARITMAFLILFIEHPLIGRTRRFRRTTGVCSGSKQRKEHTNPKGQGPRATRSPPTQSG